MINFLAYNLLALKFSNNLERIQTLNEKFKGLTSAEVQASKMPMAIIGYLVKRLTRSSQSLSKPSKINGFLSSGCLRIKNHL